MISYNQHVLVRTGNSEQLWLNEGLSHLSEELAALHFKSLGDETAFSRFVLGDLFNAFLYLKQPGDNFLLFDSDQSTGTLAERGAAWLFLRWLVDQFGEHVPRRLVETRERGAANIVQALGEPFPRLLSQWFLANYVSDLPGFTPSDRLQYRTWRFRTTYASLYEQVPTSFDRPFPLVPLEFTGGAFVVDGVLHAGSGAYYLVEQPAGAAGFALRFAESTGGAVNPVVEPRLHVLRIR